MVSDSFSALALAEPIQRALKDLGYTTPSPIQNAAIPALLRGEDLLACAQTGTGKTAAFALPILHKLLFMPQETRPGKVTTLVLTPTRELAVQVAESFAKYGKHIQFNLATVFGGVSAGPQIKALRQGLDVLVATPGRLLDLMSQKCVDLSSLQFLVLDEVDRMLDMGFINDVRKITARVPKNRQSLFFSATLAPTLADLAASILNNPTRIAIEPEVTTAEKIDQSLCLLNVADKNALLSHLLKEQSQKTGRNLTLVFHRTKHGADKLAKQLKREGIQADAIHGNKSQSARQRSLLQFKEGKTKVLVATDVAARGLDVRDVTLVINYNLPEDTESYVHRIGRTARAGAEGKAISFCGFDELELLRDVEKLIRQTIAIDTNHPFHCPSVTQRVEQQRAGTSARRGTNTNGNRNGNHRSGNSPTRNQTRRGRPQSRQSASTR